MAWFALWLFFTRCILVWHITQHSGSERDDTASIVKVISNMIMATMIIMIVFVLDNTYHTEENKMNDKN